MNNKKYFGDTILFIDSIIWGIGYIVVLMALNAGSGEFFLTASRFTIATLIQLPFIFKKLKKLNKKIISKGVILGLLLVSGFVVQTIGQKYTTATNTAFLTSVNVVLIPFTSMIIIKKKLQVRSIIAAIITFVGIGFLTVKSSLTINNGDIYVLVCAVLFALYASVTDLAAKKEDASLLVFIQFLTSAILASILFAFSNEKIILNNDIIFSALYLGVLSNFVATLLYAYGLKYTSAERGSIILSLESIFGSILAIIIFNEPFNYRLIIGSLLILFAILYSEKIIFKKKLLLKK